MHVISKIPRTILSLAKQMPTSHRNACSDGNGDRFTGGSPAEKKLVGQENCSGESSPMGPWSSRSFHDGHWCDGTHTRE